jgi:hypothetical protein
MMNMAAPKITRGIISFSNFNEYLGERNRKLEKLDNNLSNLRKLLLIY